MQLNETHLSTFILLQHLCYFSAHETRPAIKIIAAITLNKILRDGFILLH